MLGLEDRYYYKAVNYEKGRRGFFFTTCRSLLAAAMTMRVSSEASGSVARGGRWGSAGGSYLDRIGGGR